MLQFPVYGFLFAAAALGAIVGSFLNVVVLRIGTGRGIGGRSACLSCSKPLSALELVPIFSYLALGGKCRGCKSAVSIQYILVEGLAALSFALIAWKFSFLQPTAYSLLAFTFVVAAVLIAIVTYDIKHLIIPDTFVYVLFALALLRLGYLATQGGLLLEQMLSALALGLFLFLLHTLSRGRWLGLGDVKLILPLALLLPWSDNLVALVLAFWSGAIVGVLLIAWSKIRTLGKRYAMQSEIPFAPFLILGTVIAYMVHVPLFPF